MSIKLIFLSLLNPQFDDYIKNDLQLCTSRGILNLQSGNPAVVSEKHLNTKYPPWCGVGDISLWTNKPDCVLTVFQLHAALVFYNLSGICFNSKNNGAFVMKIKFLLIGTSLSLIPNLTFAQCVATQDCETLGYTETSCNGGKGVKCPFGNKWACFKTDSECEQQFCDKYGFQYTCSSANETGGSGNACSGKYTSCTCASGYEWNGSSCQQLNGAQDELYYCNGTVVGVKTTGMDFYVAMKDLGNMNWDNAMSQCQNYAFCGNIKGTLPTRDQLLLIYLNKSQVNSLLSTNGGTKMTEDDYWSSTYFTSQSYIVHMSSGTNHFTPISVNHYFRPILTSW